MEVAPEVHALYELYTPTDIIKTLTTKETYYQIEGMTAGTCQNCSGNTGTITPLYDGVYGFQGVATIRVNIGCLLTFALCVNGEVQTNINTKIDFKNSQDAQTFSGSGLLNLHTGDSVCVKGKADTDGITATISKMNITLTRLNTIDYP